MKPQSAKAASKSTRPKASKRGKLPKPPSIKDFPELGDQFTRDTEELTQEHLIKEHLEKMQAMQQLHQAQVWSIHEQLQIALFKIWNEMWLQKKATANKAHKDWLKVLAG